MWRVCKGQFTYDDNGHLTDSEAAFSSGRLQYDEARNLAGAFSSVTIADQPASYGRTFDETFGSAIPALRQAVHSAAPS